ncbi:GMC family oxidoreductase N-terminal domain-containing protein [Amylibacter sp.]|nr:GMC family oxidoreductase N-terminal domain-containing protein [Amylibacter sp.]
MHQYDYVIVGAGSAGSALASRLSESGKFTVCLLEAGGSDKKFWVQMPLGYGKVFHDSSVNWRYMTEPEPNLDNQSVYWPRGKVLGGSSSINAMVWVRGHKRDYEEWDSVAPGWGWNNVEKIFKRMESWDGVPDISRGTNGPQAVHDVSQDVHPLTISYLEAASQIGIEINPDYNGPNMEGATCYQISTKGGIRASAARSYLWASGKRQNLDIQKKAQVIRVIFEGKRAVGVKYIQKGQIKTIHARAEVILSGGAINSPQLLQLSGVGPGELLQRYNIDIVHESHHVGKNLQDHLGSDIYYRANVPTLNQELHPMIGKLRAGLKYILTRKGPLSLSLNQGGGFIQLDPNASGPDLQLYFSPVSYTRAPAGVRPLMNPDPFPGFLMGFNPCKPTSVGNLQICSNDPMLPPKIHSNYLDTEYDKKMMIEGIQLIRRIANAPALNSIIKDELAPGNNIKSEADIAKYIRQKAWSVFHPCSTCRMGSDPNISVVDPKLRVYGVENLRIADASIFPTIPTGNINAPSIMVGEYASDIILKDAKKRKGL